MNPSTNSSALLYSGDPFRSNNNNKETRTSSNPISIITKSHSCRLEPTEYNCDNAPPQSIIDPKDGHFWRAKYCVLEDGVLYFYRHEADAEESNAKLERQRFMDQQSQQQQQQQLQTNNNHNNHRYSETTNPAAAMSSNFPLHLAHSPMPSVFGYNCANNNYHQQQRYRSQQEHDNNNNHTNNVNNNINQNGSDGEQRWTWEKCIALSSVGAVRSADAEYGPNSFELSSSSKHDDETNADNYACEDDEDINYNNNNDKLVLRARSSDEMNEWLFQFHRSIASFVMDALDIMASAASTTTTTTSATSAIASTPSAAARNRSILHTPMSARTTIAANINNRGTSSSYREGNFFFRSPDRPLSTTSAASSMTAHHLAAFSPLIRRPISSSAANASASLSHGHGRHSHRRRIGTTPVAANGTVGRIAMSLQDSPTIPLLPTTPLPRQLQLSSPLTFRPSSGGFQEFSSGKTSAAAANNASAAAAGIHSSITSLVTPTGPPRQPKQLNQQRSLFETPPRPPEIASSTTPADVNPETERPPPSSSSSSSITGGKYVPPQLRNRESSTAEAEAATSSATTPAAEATPSPLSMTNGVSLETKMEDDGIATTTTTAVSVETIAPFEEPAANGAAVTPVAARSSLSSPTKKYIPPSLRRKMAAAAGTMTTPSSEVPAPQKYVPPHMRNKTPGDDCGIKRTNNYPTPTTPPRCSTPRAGDEPDFHNDAATMQYLYTPFVSEYDTAVGVYHDVKLGGCADPTLIKGSILDSIFIPRKASRLGKVRSSPFGSISSAAATATTRKTTTGDDDDDDDCSSSSNKLRWEVGAVSECGVRESNEDSFLLVNDLLTMFTDHRKSATVWDSSSSSAAGSSSNSHTSGLFAIFDGHCGNHAARFAAERLIPLIEENSIRRTHEVGIRGESLQVEDILRSALIELDLEFCNLCVTEGRDWESGSTALVAALVNKNLVIAQLGDARGVLCRSVATEDEVATHEHDDGWTELSSEDYSGHRYCLWKEVSQAHSPSRPDERSRIERANGWITTEKEIPVGQLHRMVLDDQDVMAILIRCFADRYQPSPKAAAPQRILHISRVCGELAVSRAIGDRDFKAAFNCNPAARSDNSAHSSSSDNDDDTDEQPEWGSSLFLSYPDDHNRCFVGDLVSNQPDFQTFQVGQPGVTEEFLLMACDGLWDVMDADDAVRVTRDLLFEKKWPAKLAANRLAELAVHLGSSDNITVIVIRFFDNDNDNDTTTTTQDDEQQQHQQQQQQDDSIEA